MNDHQKIAYVTLLETAERLLSLKTNAAASTHQLAISEVASQAITVALNALHTAQREMEKA